MNILNEIHKIVKENYPQVKEKITPKTKLKSVGLDSLDLVEIALKLEKIHSVQIDDSKLMELQTKTVQDLITEIEKLEQKK